MAAPTTRAALKTRTIALVTELDELVQGAHNLGLGADGGTAAQQDACTAVKHRLRGAHKDLISSGAKAVAGSVS
jgi:hypothetical protein